MNPVNGEVYAMGSYPSFDPTVFTKTLSEATYKRLTSVATGDPLLNRAIQSAGPTGSTFKPITATAALQSGNWTIDDVYDDTGKFCFPGTTECLQNAGGAVNGAWTWLTRSASPPTCSSTTWATGPTATRPRSPTAGRSTSGPTVRSRSPHRRRPSR